VLRARETGTGCHLDIAQSDAAAFTNWLPIEGHRAYRRPEPKVTGNPADGGLRRTPGPGGMEEAVRYQYYRSSDGHVLFQASEQEFWRNFCAACDRLDLYQARPGRRYGDHATGDRTLRATLQEIFLTRSTHEWVQFGLDINCPIAPVNAAETIDTDPQFAHRMPWWPAAEHGADLVPTPVNVVGSHRQPPRRAPEVGVDTDQVLASLGYSAERIDDLRRAGALGPTQPEEPEAAPAD